MNETILRGHYRSRGFQQAEADRAVDDVRALETWLAERDLSLARASVDEIRSYIRLLIADGRNTLPCLLALARYFYLIDRKDVYLFFTSLLGGLGVIESIRDRVSETAGKEAADGIFESLERPPLGSEPADFPEFTSRLMARLEARLPESTVRQALAGNNHGIPESAFDEEKQHYAAAACLDEYLADRHRRKVEELRGHAETKTVWYEQIITPEVVDYVASNQEILSAVRKDDTLFITKIPYDPAKYLAETDPVRKRYYACHCPFVREAILSGKPVLSPSWCYCSAGYAKFPFEVVLGRKLQVKLLACALAGDPVCRFAVSLKDDPPS